MQTYWLISTKGLPSFQKENSPAPLDDHSVASKDTDEMVKNCADITQLATRNQKRFARLVDWNVDVLRVQLQKIVAMRGDKYNAKKYNTGPPLVHKTTGGTVLEEVREIIALPSQASEYKLDPDEVKLGDTVMSQLRMFVTEVAKRYRNNPFHSFDHAR